MAFLPTDLVRVAELIMLGAQTARLFSDTSGDGKASPISDAAARIEAAAKELIQIGREMEKEASNEP